MIDINSELKDILDKYDRKLESKEEKENKKLSENKDYLNEFEKLCTEVIRPVMENIGNSLKDRGHEYKIIEKKGSGIKYKKDTDSSIEMILYPYPYKWDQISTLDVPSISFITSITNKEIIISESNMMPGKGGSSGSIGSYKMDEIKPELVQKTIILLLKKIL
jgi:hypothetical protein